MLPWELQFSTGPLGAVRGLSWHRDRPAVPGTDRRIAKHNVSLPKMLPRTMRCKLQAVPARYRLQRALGPGQGARTMAPSVSRCRGPWGGRITVPGTGNIRSSPQGPQQLPGNHPEAGDSARPGCGPGGRRADEDAAERAAKVIPPLRREGVAGAGHGEFDPQAAHSSDRSGDEVRRVARRRGCRSARWRAVHGLLETQQEPAASGSNTGSSQAAAGVPGDELGRHRPGDGGTVSTVPSTRMPVPGPFRPVRSPSGPPAGR